MSLASRLMLSFPPLFVFIGSFVADFNETHVLNPNWPPHAKFHNGQTMSMSAGLCLASLYFTWRLPHLKTLEAKREALIASWILGSLYCATGLSAIAYPGSSGVCICFIACRSIIDRLIRLTPSSSRILLDTSRRNGFLGCRCWSMALPSGVNGPSLR
jgi:hypothetical protein